MWKKIIIIGIGGFLWGLTGGFDWIVDSYDSWNYIIPVVQEEANSAVIADELLKRIAQAPILTEEEIWKLIDSMNLDGEGTEELDIDEATYNKNKELFEKVEEEYNRVTDELNKTRKK